MRQILEIEYKGGHVYQYFGVPREVYERLINMLHPSASS
jgi:hypothetical protein